MNDLPAEPLDSRPLAERCAARMWANDRASQSLGMQIESIEPGRAVLSMVVREEMLNGHAICHGGFIFTLADSAFAFSCNTYNQVTVAQAAKIDFLRPAFAGERLRAESREVHRGGRTGVYDVEVRRDDGMLIACFRGNSHSLDKQVLEDQP